MDLIKHLKILKEKLLSLKDNKPTKEFDKWLTEEYVNADFCLDYASILADLMTKIEQLEIEHFGDGIILDIDSIRFSDLFMKNIIKSIDRKIAGHDFLPWEELE